MPVFYVLFCVSHFPHFEQTLHFPRGKKADSLNLSNLPKVMQPVIRRVRVNSYKIVSTEVSLAAKPKLFFPPIPIFQSGNPKRLECPQMSAYDKCFILSEHWLSASVWDAILGVWNTLWRKKTVVALMSLHSHRDRGYRQWTKK